jgi:hypothetical protein
MSTTSGVVSRASSNGLVPVGGGADDLDVVDQADE